MPANHLKEYFNFSKKERNGIIVLLMILFAVWFTPALFAPKEEIDEKGFAAFKKDISQFEQQALQPEQGRDSLKAFYASSKKSLAEEHLKSETFYFDPNALPAAEWKRLGIPDRTIKTIQNFIAKGGLFYKPADLAKIYGLKKMDFERLMPYIRIRETRQSNEKESRRNVFAGVENTGKYEMKIVEINTSDTSAFIALPGIGSILAARITSFREKLGGFYSIAQVAEVYGLSDSVFQKIKPYLQCNTNTVKKIPINTATIDELKAHPYIKYQVGNAVIQYRLQHGNFQKPDDLMRVHLVTDELLKKLSPYISY